MPIVIKSRNGVYTAVVTPPHGLGMTWSTQEAMSRQELLAALQEQGCHQTDIGDAFYEADPEWLMRE